MPLNKISSIKAEALSKISASFSGRELKEVYALYLGKKGVLKSYLTRLKDISDPEARRASGSVVNELYSELEVLITKKKYELKQKEINLNLNKEKVDLTTPERPEKVGKIHPIAKIINEISVIFSYMGFKLADGPDVEDEFHVFDALNTPEYHPAREESDTFYLNKTQDRRMVLRPHTTSVQVRVMENSQDFPIKVIAPGRVYRHDFDKTHTPMFHQIDGFYVDKNINMGHLKFCLNYFLNKFFDSDKVKIRFRPSFFPFTEPSAEIDISYDGSDWIEVLGSGIIHPNVLENVGINPKEHSGFAFGMGIERLAMLKYGISDLRDFYNSNMMWLNHYGFNFSSLTI
ncbi:phenylalanine--tRNA ligase subunit alpha [Candidatus Mesenet endosymbiont of Agriotes lineatus]|uniref:phenylalanine--tRNA ligase subunit alpha n=1 Tax=Candidatus Mesenet endosymbiont of Agriotes lineatus TaxID=3077948 RepID=UPI0030CC20FE